MLIRFDEARSLTFASVFLCLRALALASFRLNELGFSSPVSPLISLRAEVTISIIVLISVMRNAGPVADSASAVLPHQMILGRYLDVYANSICRLSFKASAYYIYVLQRMLDVMRDDRTMFDVALVAFTPC